MKSIKDYFKSRLVSDAVLQALPEPIAREVERILAGSQTAIEDLTLFIRELNSKQKYSAAKILGTALYRTVNNPGENLCQNVCSAARECKDFELAYSIASEAHLRYPNNWYLKAEYLQAAFALNKQIDALPIAKALTEAQPDIPWGWHLYARAAEQVKDFTLASSCWEKAVEGAPENGNYTLALLNALIKQGEKDRARKIFEETPTIKSSSEAHKIRNALYIDESVTEVKNGRLPSLIKEQLENTYFLHDGHYDYDLMIETAKQLVALNSNSFMHYVHLFNAYFRGGRYDEAWEVANYLSERFPERASLILAHRAKVLDGWGRYQDALTLLESEIDNFSQGINHVKVLAQHYYRIGRVAEAFLLAQKAVSYANRNGFNANAQTFLAEVEIAIKQPDRAVRSLQAVRAHLGDAKFENQFPELASWLAFHNGDLNEARRIFAIKNVQRPLHALFKSSPPVELKAAETESLQRKQIVMLTHVYNEMPKIKSFLMHYRRLGVEVFYITDNASTDGTQEYLMHQPDVRLFYSDTAFSHAGFGIWWINYLVQRYGNERWCMHADVDELLVYPHCENIGLPQLTEYMEARGEKALLSYMLDLFPKTISAALDWDGLTPPQEICPYFDDTIHFVPRPRPPYLEMWGGFRARIMGDGHGPGQLSIKTPLFKAEKEFTLLLGTHYTTPVVASDIMSACLHFKFIGDIEDKYKQTVEHDEHHDSCYTYRQYLSWLDTVSLDDDLRGTDTHYFKDSNSLLKRGLIKSTVHFEEYAARQIPTFQAGLPKTFILTAPGNNISSLRIFLKSLGLKGEIESVYPVHTKINLIDDYAGSQIFSGLAILHDFEYLYHLIPEAYFILVPPQITNWGHIFDAFCLKELNLVDFYSVTKLFNNKKHFNELDKKQRGIIISLIEFMGSAYSWNDASRLYVERVQQFFKDKEPGRFVTLERLEQESFEQELKKLRCFTNIL